jgi:hypothetical protein
MRDVQPGHDPYYEGPASAYIRAAVAHRTRYDVYVQPIEDGRVVEIDHDHDRVIVAPGLSAPRFRSAMSGVVLYVLGGPSWAPDFSTGPHLRIVRDLPRRRPAEGLG